MAISLLGFAETDKGAARWYCKDAGEPYSFVDDYMDMDYDNANTIVVRENSSNSKTIKYLREKEKNDEGHNYVFLSDKDIEDLYSDMMDKREIAIKAVSDEITPFVFFEYHIVTCQQDGFIITGIEESDDKTEKYLTAFHRDSHRTLFLAVSMDGHLISDAIIVEKGKDYSISKCAEYSEHFCKSMVESIRQDCAFDNIEDLPLELANIRSDADRVLSCFDGYYYGGSERDCISMDVLEVIEELHEKNACNKRFAEYRTPISLYIYNTNKIKNRPLFQGELADAIDYVCSVGGKVVINDMGSVSTGYATLYKRIEGYEKGLMVRVNPYGSV